MNCDKLLNIQIHRIFEKVNLKDERSLLVIGSAKQKGRLLVRLDSLEPKEAPGLLGNFLAVAQFPNYCEYSGLDKSLDRETKEEYKNRLFNIHIADDELYWYAIFDITNNIQFIKNSADGNSIGRLQVVAWFSESLTRSQTSEESTNPRPIIRCPTTRIFSFSDVIRVG